MRISVLNEEAIFIYLKHLNQEPSIPNTVYVERPRTECFYTPPLSKSKAVQTQEPCVWKSLEHFCKNNLTNLAFETTSFL